MTGSVFMRRFRNFLFWHSVHIFFFIQRMMRYETCGVFSFWVGAWYWLLGKYLVIHCNYMFTQCTVLTEVYPSYRIIGHLHTAQERSNEYTVYCMLCSYKYPTILKNSPSTNCPCLVLSPLCSTIPADIPRSYCPCLELSPLILYLLTIQDHIVPASNYHH